VVSAGGASPWLRMDNNAHAKYVLAG
jgi:hypothetical protein